MNDIEADLLIANAKIKQLEEQLADYHHTSELVNGKMAENQRLRRINENLQEQLAAERAKYAELQRYNVDCTKQCGMLQMDKVNLQTLLTESQRRERAAVEDLNGTGACFTCKHFRRNGGDCFGAGRCRLDGIEIWPCNEPGVYRVEAPDDGRKMYEWRGPQEAGEGGQDGD